MAKKTAPIDAPPSKYVCTSCGKEKKRDMLTVKKVMFLNFGRNGKALRSRVVAWLCDECRAKDKDWAQEASRGGAPRPPGGKK